ncbi:ubiquinol-cytochrome c reductase iron-sulfur subunit [Sporocytophaga myxococcoides]|uniref:QcrA and Rieske domain-containing protein n=1 Tax=Sporocytophaga myxococcoides TaxID=153721 RepID=UPI00048DBFC7|nr:Rieske 2Fe-2S domain-containing protein [Sporocytophaga myxococcoides]
MQRLNFLKATFLIFSFLFLGNILSSCKKDNPNPYVNFTLDINENSNSALRMPGGSVVSNGAIVVRYSNSYLAFSNSCTYDGCGLSYSSISNRFICSCDGSEFDINGRFLSGNPSPNIPQFNVTQNGSLLTIISK